VSRAQLMVAPKQKPGQKTSSGYNSRLQKGGALLEDMRLLVRAWQSKNMKEQVDIAIAQNILGKNSRSRAVDTFRRAFIPRFLEGRPPQAWRIPRPLEDLGVSVDILKPVYYWITARNEQLLYDFVAAELFPMSKSSRGDVTLACVTNWITSRLTRAGRAWSETVTIKVARGMLATLRDFGILEGTTRKRIAPVYVPVESFAYIAFALHDEGASGSNLINHPDWTLFLFSPPVVERMFLEADRHGFLRFQAAGKIVRIDFAADTLKEMANVVAARSN